MSDLFPTLLQETHKPALMAGTSTLAYGGGMADHSSETGLSQSGSGRAAETASFPGGIAPDAGSQLDALRAKALSTSDVETGLPASAASSGSSSSLPRSNITSPAGLDITAGHAVAALVASGGNASPASPAAQEGVLPRLQFLSDETAIRTVASVVPAQDTTDKLTPSPARQPAPSEVAAPASALGTETDTHNPARLMPVVTEPPLPPLASGPKGDRTGETVSGSAASASPSSALSADVSTHPAMLRSAYVDNPAYAFAVSGTTMGGSGWSDTLSFSDNYNQAYPGVVVNTAYDDIGERRDAAWKLPGMHAYASTDSGYRADQVQTYWEQNADAIGMAIIGTTIPMIDGSISGICSTETSKTIIAAIRRR